MFICGFCKKQTVHGEKQTLIATETRPKTYPQRKENGPWFGATVIDNGGVGSEIVKETPACEECAKAYNKAA